MQTGEPEAPALSELLVEEVATRDVQTGELETLGLPMSPGGEVDGHEIQIEGQEDEQVLVTKTGRRE